MRWQAIVGAGDAGKRHGNDFYQTPPDVTQALLDLLQLPRGFVVWEPACGKGDMAETIRENGYSVIRTDIVYGEDFLTMTPPDKYDMIITNPPFFAADKFIERAWELGKPFSFLLKSQYWHAARRRDLFTRCTPDRILPLTWRPDFAGGGKPLMDVMWCTWQPKYAPLFPTYIPLRRPGRKDDVGE